LMRGAACSCMRVPTTTDAEEQDGEQNPAHNLGCGALLLRGEDRND
jgi:hypothetical protein